MCLTPAPALQNEGVLWQMYLFYAFHAESVKFTRTTGKGTVQPTAAATAATLPAAVAAALANPDTRHDKKLLGLADFMQLLRDFRLLTGTDAQQPLQWVDSFLEHPGSYVTQHSPFVTTDPSHRSPPRTPSSDAYGGRINAYAAGTGTTSGFGEVVSFETKLSFREFLRCLLKLAEEKYAGEKVRDLLA